MKHIEKTLKRNENLWKKKISCLIFPFLTIVFLRLVIFLFRDVHYFSLFFRCVFIAFFVFSRDVHYFSLFFQCVHFFPDMFITFHFFNVFLNIRLFIFTFFMYVHYFHCLFNVFSFVQLNVVHFVFFSGVH